MALKSRHEPRTQILISIFLLKKLFFLHLRKYERLGVKGKLHTFDERDYIEIADFAGLESKLEQNNIPERTVQLLLLVKNIRRNCPFPLVEKERPYTFEDFRREHELQIQLNSAS